jgi:nitrate reductase gamma subunit
MRIWAPLLLVVGLAAAAFAAGSTATLRDVLAVAVPYLALAAFLVGIVARVVRWARSPVPFRITTTTGQQRSLPWIRQARLDNPYTGFQTAARMAVEVLGFRSLFRNNRSKLRANGDLGYSADKWLWAGALAFHWSLLVVLLRHARFFVEPTPAFVAPLESVDGFFQVGVPEVYITSVVFVVALGYLFLRRVSDARLRYLSLPADYFPLFLLLGIGLTGIFMRHVAKVDLVRIKELMISLVRLDPRVPEGLEPLFLVHLFLVSTLFAYLPFSKLTHMAGVLLSPTRNLANNNRSRRHLNPWNPPIVGHSYAEWEEEFHDKLVAAGIPLDRE